MQQFAGGGGADVVSSQQRIRGWRAGGAESPLRSVIGDDERLLVCAAVRFPDRPSDQRLWLTDSRFLFTKTQGPFDKLVVGVPLSRSALTYEIGTPFPLRLNWVDELGLPCSESFRSETWKDQLRQGISGGVAGGATQGIVGVAVGAALGAAIAGGAGDGDIAPQDRRLYAALSDACKTPASVRPVDLTFATGQSIAGRLLLVIPLSVFAVAILAAGFYTAVSFETKQAYEAATVCGRATVHDCRLEKTAVVTGYRGADGKSAFCDLTMSRPDGSAITVYLHTVDICTSGPGGETMTLEYWRGKMTAVIPPAGPAQETDDNPEYAWRGGYVITAMLGVLWVIFGIAALIDLSGRFARRARLRASARSAGYTT